MVKTTRGSFQIGKKRTCSSYLPGLPPDCSEVSHTDSTARACVQIPADLKVGMVCAGPANAITAQFKRTGGGGQIQLEARWGWIPAALFIRHGEGQQQQTNVDDHSVGFGTHLTQRNIYFSTRFPSKSFGVMWVGVCGRWWRMLLATEVMMTDL